MVLGFVVGVLIAFLFVMGAAYVGAMLALDVYFDPDKGSIFVSNHRGPPTAGDPPRNRSARSQSRSSENR